MPRLPDDGVVKNKNIKVRLDEETYLRLTIYCQANDISMSDLIRDTLKKFLK
jgi:antitoxin component of RelBE/YafQ-DinJ toxin-antitoxin module